MWPHLEDHCPHSLRSAPPSENTCDLFLIFKRLIYLWLCWVFIAVRGLSLVIACRGFSLAAVCGLLIAVASHRSDFSVRSTNSRRAGSGLVVQTQLSRGMWNLPRPGIKPMSPALVGGFLTTGPSGRSRTYLKIEHKFMLILSIQVWQLQDFYLKLCLTFVSPVLLTKYTEAPF